MIEVNHLTKKYGEHTAVSDLSFTIEKGQIYGLLGPNGAGKSTTMNIMTGCLAATSGDVKIDGYDIFEDAMKAKKLIGYLPELPPLYLDSTPFEYLEFVARAKRVPEKDLIQHVLTVMEKTNIMDVRDRLIKNLSKGYRQRVGIAQAIIGDPEIIILDEPTVGLDPRQIIEIRELIESLAENHTVILSSHILSEVQAICSKIIIISKGKLVAFDTPENLTKMLHASTTIQIVVEGTEDEIKNIIDGIDGVDDVVIKNVKANKITADITSKDLDSKQLNEIIFFAFSNAGKPIQEIRSSSASLEDIFIELTNSDYEEEETVETEQSQETENSADETVQDITEEVSAGAVEEVPETENEEKGEED